MEIKHLRQIRDEHPELICHTSTTYPEYLVKCKEIDRLVQELILKEN